MGIWGIGGLGTGAVSLCAEDLVAIGGLGLGAMSPCEEDLVASGPL